MMTVLQQWEKMENDFEGDEKVCLWNANNGQTIGTFDVDYTLPIKYWDLLVLDTYKVEENTIVMEVVDKSDL